MKKTNIIAISNQKGGVGKSCITFNLAMELAGQGFRTLIIDNDPQGNLSSVFFDSPEEIKSNINNIYSSNDYQPTPQNVSRNLDLIGADIRLAMVIQNELDIIYRLKESLNRIKKKYDFILIDCLPSFGHLLTAAFNAANYVLIPVKPSPFDIYGLNDLLLSINNIKKRINPDLDILGIILNMVDGRKTTLADMLEQNIRSSYNDLVFSGTIPKSVKFEECLLNKESVINYAPNTKIASEFHRFFQEFLTRVKKG